MLNTLKEQISNMKSNDPSLLKEKENILEAINNLEFKVRTLKKNIRKENKNGIGQSLSSLPYPFAKSLQGRLITIKEKETGKTFNVKVVDHCFEDQKGIIVAFQNCDNSKLKGLIKKYNIVKNVSLWGTEQREADFRNLFEYGNGWTFQGLFNQ